jgi:hypothetical protein
MDWCYMCKKGGKSFDHLLLHCEVARDLWVFGFLSFWDGHWSCPKRVVEFLAGWRDQFGSHCKMEVWKMVPLCLM